MGVGARENRISANEESWDQGKSKVLDSARLHYFCTVHGIYQTEGRRSSGLSLQIFYATCETNVSQILGDIINFYASQKLPVLLHFGWMGFWPGLFCYGGHFLSGE